MIGILATRAESVDFGAEELPTAPRSERARPESGFWSARPVRGEAVVLRRSKDVEASAPLPKAQRKVAANSGAMCRLLERLEPLARAEVTVTLIGETGTGKDVLARTIHQKSARRNGPFVVFDCGAVAQNLAESELLGHERGAFTGACVAHVGAFERAHGGTLFLDEIGEIDARTQVKLLRVLQERVLVRVGGSQDVPVNTRLVAATHRDLDADVAAGRFRADLLYRLDVIRILVPPLRARSQDIAALLAHFLDRFAAKYGRSVPELPSEVAQALLAYRWPGNVRELENAVERAVVLSRGSVIELDDLPPEVRTGSSAAGDGRSLTFAVGTPLEEIERRVIHATLAHTGGDKRVCAQLLGIATRTIYRRLEEQRTGEVDEA